jgi:DNA-directed RNA polymerase subunit RPC12/RpoP/uncharacterized membrane protein
VLIAAKCTQCGADIRVDLSRESGICPYCGTVFISEKPAGDFTYIAQNADNNYNTEAKAARDEKTLENEIAAPTETYARTLSGFFKEAYDSFKNADNVFSKTVHITDIGCYVIPVALLILSLVFSIDGNVTFSNVLLISILFLCETIYFACRFECYAANKNRVKIICSVFSVSIGLVCSISLFLMASITPRGFFF